MEIPNNLKTYLEGHLKIMMSLQSTTRGDDEYKAEWGIFFSIRSLNQPNYIDGLFQGEVEIGAVTSNQLGWKPKQSLWFVPLNKKANEISREAIRKETNRNIVFSTLEVRNKTGGNSWRNYTFTGTGTELNLNFEADTQVDLNRDFGKWHTIKHTGDEDSDDWNIWLTSESFNREQRIITFAAPFSHIINENGLYQEFELSVGVRDSSHNNLGPYLSIDKKGFEDHWEDCPFVWKKDNRVDDLVLPEVGADRFEYKKFVDEPLRVIDGKDRSKEFIERINKDDEKDLDSWIINEDENLSIVYARSFELEKIDFLDDNFVKVIQINRNEKAVIFVKLFKPEKILTEGAKLLEKLRIGIESTQASNPIGIVPNVEKLKEINDMSSWVGEWETDYNFSACSQKEYNLDNSKIFRAVDSGSDRRVNLTLSLLKTTNFSSSITLKNAEFESNVEIQANNDNGTALRFLLKDYEFENDLTLIDGAFEFDLVSLTENEIKTKNLPPKLFGEIRFTLQDKKTRKPFFLWQYNKNLGEKDIVVQYSLEDFSLPVKRVRAAGQDLINNERFLAPESVGAVGEGQGERNEPPLIIPISDQKENDAGSDYFLTFSESVNIGQDYRLDVKLQELNPKAGEDNSSSIKAVIVDTNPQFIGLLDARFLQQPGFDDGAWILARRSQLSLENGAWEILDDSANTEGFKLILPAQTIGEAYVKNNKENRTQTDGEPIFDPQEEPIEYKFGSPAILRLSNERLERRYVAPPWNLRHIWGQPGSESPGVPFLEAQFELLYGLIGYLKPEDTFIAELASKLGEIPVPPDNSIFWKPTDAQKAAFSIAWRNYLQFYRAWKSRLAILELSKENAFGKAKFVENLKYFPRIGFKSTLLRNLKVYELDLIIGKLEKLVQDDEINLLKKDAKELRKLVEQDQPSSEKDSKLKESLEKNEKTKELYKENVALFERFGASLRYPIKDDSDEIPEHGEITPENLLIIEKKVKASHDKNGLAGGFHYGFESKAIYKEFWREAFKDGSSSAELEAPAFSSLGGWGKQTAKFAGDKTVIKSTTAMGRTNFYAVERIGRIGVLWHKAKHVIEYERTVVPSVYFDKQPELLGRPLVRKVREYIEILEPSKNYPDFKDQADDAPGSIKACHFKSKVIPVRSSWGKDVSFKDKTSGKLENYGWEICLWHPDADPKLFPKPQVIFELIPPANSNIESVTVNLSEPQNLWFYTDTREKVLMEDGIELTLTADTSKWQAIKYVDYTDLPIPNEKHLAPSLDTNSGKGMEKTMPELLDVPPGFERFTFRVDKSELPSGVANRYNDKSGISGKMMAVTMMRKRYEKDEKPQQHLKNEYKVFQALVESPESPINKIYNGEFSNISSIDVLKTKVTSFFIKEIDNKKLFELFNTLDSDNTSTLKYFKDLYQNTTTPIPEGQEPPPDYPDRLKMFPTKFLWKEAVVSAEGLLNRTVAIYDEQARICKNEIAEIIKQGGHQKDEAVAALQKFKARIGSFHLNIDYGIEFISKVQNQVELGFKRLESNIDSEKEIFLNQIASNLNEIQKIIDDAENDLASLKIKSLEILDGVINNCNDSKVKLENIKLPNSAEIQDLKVELISILEDITTKCDILKNNINSVTDLESLREELETAKTFINAEIENYADKIKDFLKKILSEIRNITKQFNEFQKQLKVELEAFEKAIIEEIDNSIKEVETKWHQGVQVTQEKIDDLINLIKNDYILSDAEPVPPKNKIAVKLFIKKLLYKKEVNKISIFGILLTIDQWLSELFDNSEISNLIEQAKKFGDSAEVEKWLKTFSAYNELEEAIRNGNKDEIIKKSAALANNINREFGKLAGEVAEKIKQVDQAEASFEAMRNSGQQVLDNYRSVWDEFTAPGMGLNRKTVSMIVNFNVKDVEQRLSITPCIARVKQFENDLEALGLRLPVTNVFEGLLPPKPEWAKKLENGIEEYGKSLLNKFNFSDILSDIGAMRLDKLFPNFKMPNNLRDSIKITQGFDKQSLTAWVNAEVDFKLTEAQSLLKIGPLELKLNKGKFVAKVRMEMDVEGKSKKENSGVLAGDWETHIANTPIMIFKEAKAIFENDKLSFDLDPSRMEMPGLLKVLTDASKELQKTGVAAPETGSPSGEEKPEVFKIGLLEVKGNNINPALAGRNIPIGVKATLDIPPISVGGGTTSMTNLSFGGHFILQFWDKELKKFGFMTGLGFYLGKQDAPFNFTAFILGGGGFVNSDITFRPEQGLTVNFVMSVHASAGLAITAGWINGSVLIMMGLEGEYRKLPGNESTASVSIFVQIIGKVDIMGLATIFISLRLEANYNGRRLIGKGTIKVKIKICWCVTIRVERQYTKELIGKEDNKQDAGEKAEKVSVSLG